MAENETLDLGDRRNKRWRVLCNRVLSGASADEAADCLVRCVKGTLSRILRHDQMRGGPEFPFGDLLGAMQRSEADRDAVLSRCHGHQYAHLLAEEPCGQDPETTMSNYCRAIGGKFLDQIEHEAMPTRFASFSGSRAFRAQVERLAEAGLQSIARQVASNPSRAPRTPPRSRAKREGLQRSLLGESLLSRRGAGV